MHVVQVGHRSISLEHLVQAEDEELEPAPKTLPAGAYRVTLERGRVFDLFGAEAAEMRAHVRAVVRSLPEGPERAPQPRRPPSVGRSVRSRRRDAAERPEPG